MARIVHFSRARPKATTRRSTMRRLGSRTLLSGRVRRLAGPSSLRSGPSQACSDLLLRCVAAPALSRATWRGLVQPDRRLAARSGESPRVGSTRARRPILSLVSLRRPADRCRTRRALIEHLLTWRRCTSRTASGASRPGLCQAAEEPSWPAVQRLQEASLDHCAGGSRRWFPKGGPGPTAPRRAPIAARWARS